MTLAIFLSCAIADGRSYLELKESKRSAIEAAPGNYAGVGVWKDYLGHAFENSLNLASGCSDREELTQTLAGFVFMPTLLSGVAVICNLMGLQSGKGLFGTVAAAINGFNFVCLIIVMSIASALYNETYCDLKLSDLFDLHYALPFVVVAVVLSIVNIVVLVATGAMRDEAGPVNATEPVVEETKEAA